MQIVDNDILYIIDRNNHRVVIIPLNSTTAANTIGSYGTASNQFNEPADVFVTNTSIYVLDRLNYRVQKWPRNGLNGITVAGVLGSVGSTLSNSTFGLSHGIYVDIFEYVYVVDQPNHRVLRFPPNSSSGTEGVVVAGDGTPGLGSSQLNQPCKVFVDNNLTMYITDMYNNRVQKWTIGASSGVTVAGSGTAGATDADFNHPRSVIVDNSGYMYISDESNNRIQRWISGGCVGECLVGCSQLNGSAPDRLSNPQAVAFDSQGALYVSDGNQNRVQRFAIRTDTGKNHAAWNATRDE
jgi:trimeric autotransporter adhesin